MLMLMLACMASENQALERVKTHQTPLTKQHPISCFKDILLELNGAKCFLVVDVMPGVIIILLDQVPSLATIFHTLLAGAGSPVKGFTHFQPWSKQFQEYPKPVDSTDVL